MTSTTIIGAGLAGLSAAITLTQAGHAVTLIEAGPAAGGRCRSYFDRQLGCRIDNGNHLLLSGNKAAMAYLDAVGARGTLRGPDVARFPFVDRGTGERWVVAPNAGRVPWWVLAPSRRVPGSAVGEYLRLLRLRRAGDRSVAQVLDDGGALYRRLLEPLAVSALNTRPGEGLARLLAAVVDESLAQGGAACVPLVPREGLSESLVDPALSWLRARGGVLETGRRVSGLRIADGRVVALETTAGPLDVERVVMAVPAWVAADLLPGLAVPTAHEAILNLHFRAEAAVPEGGDFIGVIGGLAEWVFVKPGLVSVTISAANHLLDLPQEELTDRVWADVQAALAFSAPLPPLRVVRERRATFMATLAQETLRPGPRTALSNLALAGDWTATGLPATIEGAIRSGRTAAQTLLAG